MRTKKCFVFNHTKKHAVNAYTGKCIYCETKVAASHAEIVAGEVAALPIETKQRVLNLLHEGKNIGQTRDATGLSLDVVCAVINENIKTARWLSAEAVR